MWNELRLVIIDIIFNNVIFLSMVRERKIASKVSPLEKDGKTPRPAVLDVIEIDGRLAQHVGYDIIVFLDNQEAINGFNWDDYSYERTPSITVGDLVSDNIINEQEWKRIKWGPEENGNPYLRNTVTFFGKYKKKK